MSLECGYEVLANRRIATNELKIELPCFHHSFTLALSYQTSARSNNNTLQTNAVKIDAVVLYYLT